MFRWPDRIWKSFIIASTGEKNMFNVLLHYVDYTY